MLVKKKNKNVANLHIITIYQKCVNFKFKIQLFLYQQFKNSFKDRNIIIILLSLHNYLLPYCN